MFYDIIATVIKMKKIVIAVSLVLMLLAGCTRQETELQKFTASTLDAGFDTFVSLVGYAKNQKEFDQYFALMKERFIHYNQLFDKYNTYEGINNIKTINDNAGKNAVEVDPEIIEMLLLAKEYHALTNGKFDITMGATMKIWHDYREKGQSLNEIGDYNPPVPTKKELQESSKYSGWQYIEIDQEKNTVYITNEKVSLDVGGIAKGFATEKVAIFLEEIGLTSGAVNGGGNIRIIGNKADGTDWTIGITSPDDPSGNSVATFINTKGNRSYVTSGDYQRYYISNNILYGHIIDPDTLYPASHFRSVTVVSIDSGKADILSTALFVLSYEEGVEYIKQYNLAHPDDQIGAVWVFDYDQIPENDTKGMEVNYYYIIASDNIYDEVKNFMK